MMSDKFSPFHSQRANYQPRLPKALQGSTEVQEVAGAVAASDPDILNMFPNTSQLKTVRLVAGNGSTTNSPITVGVVLSGVPAPGGHNAIAGLFDGLKKIHPDSRLLGFLNGPIGVIQGDYTEITSELVDEYRNTGGFDMIASGRDKIESAEDIDRCVRSLGIL